MKKRLIANILSICVLLGAVLPLAYATEDSTEETTEETAEETEETFSTEKEGTCGDDLTWVLDGHTLTISGSGEMDAGSPWEFYKDSIYEVIFDGDITTVGDGAFESCNNLETVDFGDALVEIGAKAFYSCNALEEVYLPDTFRKFGAECFRDCENLEKVFCEGPMPSFKSSCLYNDHTVEVYFSYQTPWPAAEIERLMSNFGGRVYVTVGDAEAFNRETQEIKPEKTERTVETTEAVTEETMPAETEPATVPVTEAPTEPATVPTTRPATEPPTEPVTEPAAETESTFVLAEETIFPGMEAEETEKEEKEGGISVLVWVLIAAGGVTGLVVLALVIRSISHKGGRYAD